MSSVHDNPFCLILARGGSKRIPFKNLQKIGGKTLLEIGIDTIQKAGWKPIVSSENLQILRHAIEHGAGILYRPENLAADTTSSIDCVLHALEVLEIQSGSVMLLQVTSPFALPQDLKDAYRKHTETGKQIFAARETRDALWSWELDKPLFPEYQGVRSQDLPPIFSPCGNFYFSDVNFLKENRSLFANAIPFALPQERAIDIDTDLDLEIARCLAQRLVARHFKPAIR